MASLVWASVDTAAETPESMNATANSINIILEVEKEPIKSLIPDISLPNIENALITKYRNQYTSAEGLKYLSAVMQRSIPYRDFIQEEISRLEVPASLLFLPVIESGFSVTAISRSGATGMWQFMKNSIGGYGIHINEWMDERRDPWITTTAAIKKLKENYDYLGDWYLALAAYNCGLGATKTAMKKGGSSDYWYLCSKGYFKPETVHYVPKFLAIAEILQKSDEYEIDWGDTSTNISYTIIPIKRAVDITVLARETGIETDIVRKANPSLFYNITPPNALYGLRIPSESKEVVELLLADNTRKLLEYYMYKVKSGDTLYALALHYGITIDMIVQHNPALKPNLLQIGTNLVIPALKQTAAYKGKKDSDTLDFSGSYLVKKGDTLWSIALAYTIQVETLAERNNLEVNSILKLGKQLRVPIL